ncbi:hypothetical protein [Lentibacillus kapialis]|nr:hypothetical protein [Lentibacillus kapialis]
MNIFVGQNGLLFVRQALERKYIEKMIPGVEIHQYPLEELEAAREWLRKA